MSPNRLLLWRHGRTAWNADRRFQGQSDPPLDPTGEEQARLSADLLAAERPDAIVSSDLDRALATGRELSHVTGLPLLVDVRLREVDLGLWEGKTREEVGAAFPRELADWSAGHILRRGGGELQTEVAERAHAAAEAAEGMTVVLVTHGGTAKALTGRLLALPEDRWRVIAPLANGRWSDLRRDAVGWRLHQHNAGLPPTTDDQIPVVDAEDPGPPDPPRPPGRAQTRR